MNRTLVLFGVFLSVGVLISLLSLYQQRGEYWKNFDRPAKVPDGEPVAEIATETQELRAEITSIVKV